MVRPSILDSRRGSPTDSWYTFKGKLDSCTAASQREPKPMGRQYQTARMKLVFIISCSSINSRQHVAAIKKQDSSLKAVLLPRNSTFGACSCRSLRLKSVSLTIRWNGSSKQGSRKQQLDCFQSHIVILSLSGTSSMHLNIFQFSVFDNIVVDSLTNSCILMEKANAFSLCQANVGSFLFNSLISNINSSSCRFILAERHVKALAMTHGSKTR
jgi:hypothetical protein